MRNKIRLLILGHLMASGPCSFESIAAYMKRQYSGTYNPRYWVDCLIREGMIEMYDESSYEASDRGMQYFQLSETMKDAKLRPELNEVVRKLVDEGKQVYGTVYHKNEHEWDVISHIVWEEDGRILSIGKSSWWRGSDKDRYVAYSEIAPSRSTGSCYQLHDHNEAQPFGYKPIELLCFRNGSAPYWLRDYKEYGSMKNYLDSRFGDNLILLSENNMQHINSIRG